MRVLIVAIAVVSITATLSCPPGFVSQGNKCVCADWPDGMVTCDEDSLNASMLIGYCMTYDNETGEVRAGSCLKTIFRNDSESFYYPLPTNVSDLNDRVCGPSNSKGLLCEECQDGFAASLSLSNNCIHCTGGSHEWIKSIATAYLPITVIFIIITTLSISVVSGPINSFLYFGQVTTFGFINIAVATSALETQGDPTHSIRISTTVIAALYNTLNLDTSIPQWGLCLGIDLSGMELLALSYTTAFYPLLIVVFLYASITLHDRNFRPLVSCWKPFLKCFLKFRRSVDPKTSVIDAFATFTLLSYMKLLIVTGSILRPTNLYNGQAEKVGIVAYYSASLRYFHAKHLPFALLSVFISLTFIAVPPIVLIFYQTSFFEKCLTRCKLNSQALRTFVETFQGCYKDGTNGTRDCRYFAGVYFIFQIIVIIFLFASGQRNFLTVNVFVCFFTALLFALVKPYKNHMYNVIDAVMLGLVGTIYILIAMNIQRVLFTGHPSAALLVLTDVLYSLPLLYLVLFIVYWVLDRKTNCIQKIKSYKVLRCFFQDQKDNFELSIPHRVLNPEEYNDCMNH